MNTKLIKLIERIVESRLLKEAFKSDLMRQLNQYVIPEMGYGNRYYNGPVIVKLLTAMGISASEVTDDQMYVGNGGGVSYSKNNPSDAVIIVNNRKQVLAVLYGDRHVRLYGSKNTYYGSKDKYMSTSASLFPGRQGKSEKTGMSSIEAMSAAELNNEKFFAIKNAKVQNSSHNDAGFNKDYSESIRINIDALSRNQYRYAEKIKDMRAQKRIDSDFPEELVTFATELYNIGSKMKAAFIAAIDSPKTSGFNANDVVSYGRGSNSRTYYTSYISMYKDAYVAIDKLETVFRKGEDYKKDYSYSTLKEKISKLKSTFK